MPVTKEIVYPVFLKCCQYTTDTFWENIFEDLAYGKTPYGTYISKNFLCCSYKNKEFSYKIEKQDGKKMYTDVYGLLVNKLGLLSQREKAKKRIEFHDFEETIKNNRKEWGTIRKKNVKDLLIENYVIDMKIQHDLTLKQAKYLLSIIFLAFVFKAITAKDVEYSDGKIHNIKGIDFLKKQVVLRRDIYSAEVHFSEAVVENKKHMADNWEKYLKGLRKMMS